METLTFDKDITVFYVTASSFPEGVMAAHQKLHSLIPFSTTRKYFGLSRPESSDNKIIYRAAAEQLEAGEAKKLNLDTIVLKKGRYTVITIRDYMKDIPAIGNAFQQLISLPDIDPQGYCVEWYVTDKEVKCMIRMKD
jgi:predicted transcriptional regulator YdeE